MSCLSTCCSAGHEVLNATQFVGNTMCRYVLFHLQVPSMMFTTLQSDRGQPIAQSVHKYCAKLTSWDNTQFTADTERTKCAMVQHSFKWSWLFTSHTCFFACCHFLHQNQHLPLHSDTNTSCCRVITRKQPTAPQLSVYDVQFEKTWQKRWDLLLVISSSDSDLGWLGPQWINCGVVSCFKTALGSQMAL